MNFSTLIKDKNFKADLNNAIARVTLEEVARMDEKLESEARSCLPEEYLVLVKEKPFFKKMLILVAKTRESGDSVLYVSLRDLFMYMAERRLKH